MVCLETKYFLIRNQKWLLIKHKNIIGIPFELLLSILFLKCNYVNACVVTVVEKTLTKPVKKGQMEAKKSIFLLLLVYSIKEAV